jgi:uroporphyrinogen decarboxylase
VSLSREGRLALAVGSPLSDTSRAVKSLLKGVPPSPLLMPEQLVDSVAALSSARGRFMKLMGFERLLVALQHREPDRVPCCPIVAGGGRRLAGYNYAEFSLDPVAAAESFLAAFNLIGGEIVVPLVDLSVEAADFGQEMVYPENSTAHPDYSRPLIKDADGYRRLKSIDFKDAVRMNAALDMLRIMVPEVGMRGVVGGFAFGPLGVLNMMRGTGELFRDCVNHPDQVMAALETITGVLVEYVEAQVETGVIIVVLDTLFASWNGLSKELWEKIEGPFVRELANAIRRKGAVVGVHNCGDGIYFDAQIRSMEPVAISFAHLPDDCSDRKELKRRYGDQVLLMGMIDTPLLSYGTPHEVIEECRRQIDDFAPGGGYILAPGCEFPMNAPLENAYAIVKAAELYG